VIAFDDPELSEEALTPAVADEIRAALSPSDPYHVVVNELRSEETAAAAYPGPSAAWARRTVAIAARRRGALVGYAYARRKETPPHHWRLDVFCQSSDASAVRITMVLASAIRERVEGQKVEWWSRGAHVMVTDSVAAQLGARRSRVIRRMDMLLRRAQLPPPAPVRSLDPDDIPALVEVNNAAFAGHAERGGLDVTALRSELQRLGNRHQDVLVSAPEGIINGFCWTRVAPEARLDRVVAPHARGEIYVLATHPLTKTLGLGAGLLAAGLDHIRRNLGADEAILYVDEANGHAIRLYEGFGFIDSNAPLVCHLLDHGTGPAPTA